MTASITSSADCPASTAGSSGAPGAWNTFPAPPESAEKSVSEDRIVPPIRRVAVPLPPYPCETYCPMPRRMAVRSLLRANDVRFVRAARIVPAEPGVLGRGLALRVKQVHFHLPPPRYQYLEGLAAELPVEGRGWTIGCKARKVGDPRGDHGDVRRGTFLEDEVPIYFFLSVRCLIAVLTGPATSPSASQTGNTTIRPRFIRNARNDTRFDL